MTSIKFDVIFQSRKMYEEGKRSLTTHHKVVEHELVMGGVEKSRASFEATRYCERYEKKG